MQLIQDIVIILFSAVVIIVICSKLKIPSVVGFLLTGIIIGPYTTGIIKDTHDIELLAEIGIVPMMFIIGIEFSIKKLNRIKNLILFAGRTGSIYNYCSYGYRASVQPYICTIIIFRFHRFAQFNRNCLASAG